MKYLLIITLLLSFSCETREVINDEFGARASMKKYEWFKDAYETLQEKKSTIKIYENNLINLRENYKSIPRTNWDKLDKQQENQWKLEIAGLKASYNKVVREYNANSKKFNWEIYKTNELPRKLENYKIK